MKQSKIILWCVAAAMVTSLIMPQIVLYFLEDDPMGHRYAIHRSVTGDMKKKSILAQTIYSKYHDDKYTISTGDTFEYAQPYYEINGEVYRNETLIMLQELEAIGLIQNSFFAYLERNQNMISRVNEFHNDHMHYEKRRVFLPDDHYETAFAAFEVENTTSKIISLKLPKKYVTCTKDVMERYIQYLELSQSDWIYENGSIRSINNGLAIKVEEIHDMISIAVIPYSDL